MRKHRFVTVHLDANGSHTEILIELKHPATIEQATQVFCSKEAVICVEGADGDWLFKNTRVSAFYLEDAVDDN